MGTYYRIYLSDDSEEALERMATKFGLQAQRGKRTGEPTIGAAIKALAHVPPQFWTELGHLLAKRQG